MSILNRISLKVLCLALPAGLAAAACGAESADSELGQGSPTTATGSVSVERIQGDDGVSIELLDDAAHGVMGITVSGPESAKGRVAELAQVQGGAVGLYLAAVAGREVPENVRAFDAKTRVDVDALEAASSNGPPNAAELAPVADQRTDRVAKSAATFPGMYCGDKLDTATNCMYSGFYAVNNGCFTSRTNDWSRQLDTVRQGFAALEMQVGTANLQSEWWNGSAWVASHNVPIAQGAHSWVRLWQRSAAPAWYRFKVAGAAGDTYHVAVQSADTPVTEMPNKGEGNGQKFLITCGCSDPGGTISERRAESCLRQPTSVDGNGREQLTHNDAFLTCQRRCGETAGLLANTNRVNFRALPGTAGTCSPNPLVYVRR
jgi:hypothetical protein